MKRDLITIAVLLLATTACTVKGDPGPAGPRGPAGAAGAVGSDGAPALIRSAPVAAGAKCANGGTRIDVGTDTNGNGILDDTEVTGSSYLCDGPPGPQGPAGPAGAWEVVAADGFVYGRTTGYAGWLWNDQWQGYVAMPEAKGSTIDTVLTSPAGLRVYDQFSGCDPNNVYIKTDDYGSVALLDKMIVAVPAFDASAGSLDLSKARLFRADNWTVATGTPAPEADSSMDFPDLNCTNYGTGPSTPLIQLTRLDQPAGHNPDGSVPRTHPGPLTLQRVTLP